LLQLGVGTIGSGLFTQVARATLVTTMSSATILAVVYFLAWKNPKDFGLGHAIAVVFLALAATGATEHAREMIRKPFTIGQYMYSNGIRRSEVVHYNQVGFTTGSVWASGSSFTTGELMFRGQCNNCHTLDGYRALRQLLHGRDRGAIVNLLTLLHTAPANSPYKNYMPPLVGTPAEIDALADYLNKMANPGASDTADAAVAHGKTFFESGSCNVCHGDGGVGGPIGPVLKGIGAHKSPDQIAAFLKKPSDKAVAGGMPPSQLSDDDLKALVAYLDSLK